MKEFSEGVLRLEALRVPLADVEAIWTAPEPQGKRVVFIPDPP
jgi:hypothetical protein